MNVRKQNSTTHPMPFFMASSTDHVTGVTGITPVVTLSLDGGSFAAASGAVTEIGNGWYSLAGNATDRANLGTFILHATGAGADASNSEWTIAPWDVFDGNLSLTSLNGVTTPGASGGLPLLDSNTTVRSNMVEINGVAASTTGNVQIDMTQSVPTSNTGQTVGDALNAARAQGFGKWTLSGTTLILYASDGTTAVRTFTLDSSTSPTSRT